LDNHQVMAMPYTTFTILQTQFDVVEKNRKYICRFESIYLLCVREPFMALSLRSSAMPALAKPSPCMQERQDADPRRI
jgi:hypothetical protein